MKTLLSALVLASTTLVSSAQAQPPKQAKPVQPMKMTCADFLEVSTVYQPAVVYWLASIDKLGVREDDTIVVDDPRIAGYFVEECRKSPTEKLATKVKKAVQDNVLKINYNGA